ncbi:hypothetical protein TW80_17125 [Loktanella sp. S4079]|nr:hypothetical protein TW80_17125 [Loktanella sp. S4079]
MKNQVRASAKVAICLSENAFYPLRQSKGLGFRYAKTPKAAIGATRAKAPFVRSVSVQACCSERRALLNRSSVTNAAKDPEEPMLTNAAADTDVRFDFTKTV